MKKSVVVLLFLMTVSLGISLFFNYKQYRDVKEVPMEMIETKAETKVENKTDSFVAPVPVSVKEGKKIVVKKPIREQKLELISENEENPDSISELITETDSTYEIPITQKRYEDSCYIAWVSGYHASLDSIYVNSKIITNNVTTTITREKKWNFGVQGGFYLTPKGVQPGIGFGFTYNF